MDLGRFSLAVHLFAVVGGQFYKPDTASNGPLLLRYLDWKMPFCSSNKIRTRNLSAGNVVSSSEFQVWHAIKPIWPWFINAFKTAFPRTPNVLVSDVTCKSEAVWKRGRNSSWLTTSHPRNTRFVTHISIEIIAFYATRVSTDFWSTTNFFSRCNSTKMTANLLWQQPSTDVEEAKGKNLIETTLPLCHKKFKWNFD